MTEELEQLVLKGTGLVWRHGNSELMSEMLALDLTFSQSIVLMTLAHRGDPPALSELASAHKLSLPTASRAVDRLVRKGLVRRVADVADRRVKRLILSPIGRRIVDDMHAARRKRLRQVLQQLSPADRTLLEQAFRLLAEALQTTE